MKRIAFVFSFLLAFVLAQAQSPAVSFTFYDNATVYDSCNGCTNPYKTRLFDGIKVNVGNQKFWLNYPVEVIRSGTGNNTFEVREVGGGGAVRFKYSQVNATTYPTAQRLYDALRMHQQQRLSGSATYLTDTTTTTLTNINALNVVNFSATQLTHTLNLPATPTNGQICKIAFNSIVTNLTISGNGTTLVGTAATTAVVGTYLEYLYDSTLAKWLRLVQ